MFFFDTNNWSISCFIECQECCRNCDISLHPSQYETLTLCSEQWSLRQMTSQQRQSIGTSRTSAAGTSPPTFISNISPTVAAILKSKKNPYISTSSVFLFSFSFTAFVQIKLELQGCLFLLIFKRLLFRDYLANLDNPENLPHFRKTV